MSSETSDNDLATAVTRQALAADAALLAMNEDQLAAQWMFIWRDMCSAQWNVYCFFDALAFHRARCQRWEEHHHGRDGASQRVRDRYLMPHIAEFIAEMVKRI